MNTLDMILFAIIFFIGAGIGCMIANAVLWWRNCQRHDRAWWDTWMP